MVNPISHSWTAGEILRFIASFKFVLMSLVIPEQGMYM